MAGNNKKPLTPEERARRRREKIDKEREKSLEEGLEGTFPASDPIGVIQPPPSPEDKCAS